jgi:hypothetical protein
VLCGLISTAVHVMCPMYFVKYFLRLRIATHDTNIVVVK